jgi:hypothetical protein
MWCINNLYQIKNHHIILNLNVAANLVIAIIHEPELQNYKLTN